jgi:hypothetical protein
MKTIEDKRISLGLVLLSVASFFYVFKSYLLNLDANHDGIMFTPALAVSQGLLPNRDFFSLYGPVTPFIQGLWLHIFGESVFQLRVFSFVITCLIALTTFYLVKNRLSMHLSIIMVLTWLVTGPSGLPWSSLLVNLMYLLVLLLLKIALDDPSRIKRELAMLLGGALCGIAIFVRIQMIVSFFILLILLVVAKPLYLRLSVCFAAGGVASLLFSMVFLLQTGALQPFIEQGIIWAADFYGTPRIDRSYLVNILWFPIIYYFIIMLKKFLQSPKFRIWESREISYQLFLIFSFFLSISILSNVPRDSVRTLFSIRGFILGSSWNLNHWLGFFMVSLSVLFFIILCVKAKTLGVSRFTELLGANLPFIFGITSLTQLYPFYDLWHVWFITPVLLASTVMSDVIDRVDAVFNVDFQVICCVFLVVSLLTSTKVYAQETYSFRAPILTGMSSSAPGAKSMDMTLLALADKGDSGHIRFVCPLGLYAAANGKYMSNDLNYVNWGNFADSSPREVTQIFICEASRNQIAIFERRGWSIVFLIEMEKTSYDDTTFVYNALMEIDSA